MPVFASLCLAAGIGSRLRPLTDTMPKPGLPVLDIPLAAWAVADLASLGGPVIMNLSRGHDVVVAALGPLLEGVELVIEEPEPVGSAATLAALKGRFRGPVVTRNADLLSTVTVADVVRTHLATGAPATIAIQPVAGAADIVDDHGRIRMVDRRSVDVAGARFLGVSVFEPAALDRLEVGGPADLAGGLLAHLIARDEVATHTHDGYALDVGTPSRFLEASLDLLYGRTPRPPAPVPGEVIEVDGGSAYIGPGATAAPSTLGAGAVILAGARVEPGAHVHRAIVWTDEVVGEGTRVTEGIRAFGTTIAALQQ